MVQLRTGVQDSVRPPLSILERWIANSPDWRLNATAGAIGGFASGVAVCPLDVIKTKLQAQGGFQAVQKGRHVGHEKVYKGLVGTASRIWNEEGVRGMYRGLGPIILGYLPTWGVYFTAYNHTKETLADYIDNPNWINFYSSIISGGCSTIVTNPIWVIKTRLMSQSGHHSRHRFSLFPKGSNTPTSRPTLPAPWHYSSTWDAAVKMYTTEGLSAFYSGLTPALLGLTHVAVQFPTYEFLRMKFTGHSMGEAPSRNKKAREWPGVLAASIFSKIIASSATYPHEVIRTRLQTQRKPVPGSDALNGGNQNNNAEGLRYRGVVRTFTTILREEGWRAFYVGMGTNMIRAVPAATVTLLTFEYTVQKLKETRERGKSIQSGEY